MREREMAKRWAEDPKELRWAAVAPPLFIVNTL